MKEEMVYNLYVYGVNSRAQAKYPSSDSIESIRHVTHRTILRHFDYSVSFRAINLYVPR